MASFTPTEQPPAPSPNNHPEPSPALSPAQLASLEEFRRYCGLKPAEMAVVVELSEVLFFKACQTIIRQGQCETCLYVLLEGEVAVTQSHGQREVELARLRPGRFFGEVALVDDGPRSASVAALQNCTLLRLDRSTLHILAGVQPSAALHLLTAVGRSLVALLRRNNEKVLDLLLAGKSSSSLPAA